MCEIRTVSIVAVLLLAAAGFYTYQVNPKVEQDSEIKSESSCGEEYIKSESPCEKRVQKVLYERRRMLLSRRRRFCGL